MFTRKTRKIGVLVSIWLVLTLLMVGCGKPQQAPTPQEQATGEKIRSIVLGTSSVGSSGYVQGVGLADLINRKASGLSVSAQAVGGSDANLRAIRDGKVDIAIVNAFSAVQAYLGQGGYSGEEKVPVRLLLQGFPSPRFIVARRASGITNLADLRGRTIIGKRRALADIELATMAYLEIAGISRNEVKIVETTETDEAYEALKIGSADAATIPQTFEAAGFQELARTIDIVVPSLTEDQAKEIIKKLGPAFRILKVPKGTFKGQEKEIITVATPMILVARDTLPADVVYTVVKIILDNYEEVKALHNEARFWTVENTLNSPPIPFHDGVIKLFKERGIEVSHVTQ